jgi:hypothetical protein
MAREMHPCESARRQGQNGKRNRRGEMRRSGERTLVVRPSVVLRRILFYRPAVVIERYMDQAVERAEDDGTARGAGGIRHPSRRQQRAKHYRDQRDMDYGKAKSASHRSLFGTNFGWEHMAVKRQTLGTQDERLPALCSLVSTIMCGKFTAMYSWREVHAFSQPLPCSA